VSAESDDSDEAFPASPLFSVEDLEESVDSLFDVSVLAFAAEASVPVFDESVPDFSELSEVVASVPVFEESVPDVEVAASVPVFEVPGELAVAESELVVDVPDVAVFDESELVLVEAEASFGVESVDGEEEVVVVVSPELFPPSP